MGASVLARARRQGRFSTNEHFVGRDERPQHERGRSAHIPALNYFMAAKDSTQRFSSRVTNYVRYRPPIPPRCWMC